MKKQYWIIIFLVLTLIGFGLYFFFNNAYQNNSQTAKYTTNRTKASINTNVNNDSKSTSEKVNIDNSLNINTAEKKSKTNIKPTETEIAKFTTKIYTKDSSRQKNISITCSTLNNTLVNNGSTFSFCNTVGQASTSKGYEKAEIFDSNGKIKQGLGGGNCQISTTLYNAVLKIPSLKVIERHPHSNRVPYISRGRDAAVAYGSYDFKFINNSGHTIKIKASSTANNVTIRLLKLS